MLIRHSNKTHEEFDLVEAERIYERNLDEYTLTAGNITSPFHLFAVEALRTRHRLHIGAPLPTDLFVMAKGEPTNPSWTKIGGRPFWPADRDWPTTSNGGPCYFLAQFNFADSLDLFKMPLPATVLLLLAESQQYWKWEANDLTFHWVNSGITPAKDLSVSSVFDRTSPFYGVIHRSADFGEAKEAERDIQLRAHHVLSMLNGTKIGGLPYLIQSHGTPYPGCEFLCQLGSIQAASQLSFPWVNQREAISLMETAAAENELLIGDLGNIYLFLEQDGTIRWHVECY